nr:ribonuclease H-like domain, reverse transcriptase, RNA-dependent DNA polymerase [Tanacetum cinerariifolium]
TKASDNAGQARKKTKHVKDYILLPLWTVDPPFSQDLKSSQDDGFKPLSDNRKKVDKDPKNKSECKDQEKEDNVNGTNNVNTVSSTVNAAGINEDNELSFDPNMPSLEDVGTFDFSNENEDDDAVADINNLDTTIQVSPTPTTRIHKDHPLDQVIRDLYSATQTRNIIQEGNSCIERSKLDRGYAGRASTIQVIRNFVVYQMDIKSAFLYGKIEEEVYVCQPPGFEDSNFPDRVYKVEKHYMDYIKLLEPAYIDSDYAGESLDRKYTTGGYQYLGCRLISWQCKKQTLVANSITEAEYVAASS